MPKRRGLAVTGETCPHYWMLDDRAVETSGTNAKMNPPLRSEADRHAVIRAIADGTIDCLATDHAPHTAEEKRQPFDHAPVRHRGSRDGVGAHVTGLVEPGHLELARAVELWTDAPRRAFGLPAVTLEPGSPADLVLLHAMRSGPWSPSASSRRGGTRRSPAGTCAAACG
jgi:dihydroorotase